jgi:predicted nucleotide-binding protein
MEPDERRQREKLDNLDRIEFELTEQDTLIHEQMKRSLNSAVPPSQRALLRNLFREVQDLQLGYSFPAVDSDDPDDLRPEIRSAYAKVVWEKKRLNRALGLIDAPSNDIFSRSENDSKSSTSATDPKPHPAIFIGHGRAKDWLVLKEFLRERLHITCVEFNSESAAGLPTQQRLEDLLMQATFAFLVMTAEDQHADGRRHARENVIHEVGLFQGKLGFRKAILLVEDECEKPSNVHGLTYIAFPKHRIDAACEEVRRVLEREHVI